MRIFISGGITDVPDYENHFKRAELELLARGYAVVNPAVLGRGMLPNDKFTHEEYMRVTLTMLDMCGGIYMLSGWEKSKGANIELQYARVHRKKVIFEGEGYNI